MTREPERKLLFHMINKHIEKNSKTMRGFTLSEYEMLNLFNDEAILSKGVQGCFDVFLEAFEQYINSKRGK